MYLLLSLSATFFIITLFFIAFVVVGIRNSGHTSLADYILAWCFGSIPLSVCIFTFFLAYLPSA